MGRDGRSDQAWLDILTVVCAIRRYRRDAQHTHAPDFFGIGTFTGGGCSCRNSSDSKACTGSLRASSRTVTDRLRVDPAAP